MRPYIFIAALTLGLFLFQGTAQAAHDFLDVMKCTTEDCADQRAGYAWAKQNSIDDSNDCQEHPESSDGFIKGCEAYVKEQEDGDKDEGDDE